MAMTRNTLTTPAALNAAAAVRPGFACPVHRTAAATAVATMGPGSSHTRKARHREEADRTGVPYPQAAQCFSVSRSSRARWTRDRAASAVAVAAPVAATTPMARQGTGVRSSGARSATVPQPVRHPAAAIRRDSGLSSRARTSAIAGRDQTQIISRAVVAQGRTVQGQGRRSPIACGSAGAQCLRSGTNDSFQAKASSGGLPLRHVRAPRVGRSHPDRFEHGVPHHVRGWARCLP